MESFPEVCGKRCLSGQPFFIPRNKPEEPNIHILRTPPTPKRLTTEQVPQLAFTRSGFRTRSPPHFVHFPKERPAAHRVTASLHRLRRSHAASASQKMPLRRHARQRSPPRPRSIGPQGPFLLLLLHPRLLTRRAKLIALLPDASSPPSTRRGSTAAPRSTRLAAAAAAPRNHRVPRSHPSGPGNPRRGANCLPPAAP